MEQLQRNCQERADEALPGKQRRFQLSAGMTSISRRRFRDSKKLVYGTSASVNRYVKWLSEISL